MKYPYSLPLLAYPYDALEPYIDARTMEIHHTKHHQAYIDNLNGALKDYPDLQSKSLIELLSQLNELPELIRVTVQNNGGGHLNHTEFWRYLTNDSTKQPYSELMRHIKQDFITFEAFQELFNNAAKGRFGSGWAWLALDQDSRLMVTSTANQDSVISSGLRPILGLDVWEHAYYLKYQNRRVDYIQAWWHVIDWGYVQEQYDAVK